MDIFIFINLLVSLSFIILPIVGYFITYPFEKYYRQKVDKLTVFELFELPRTERDFCLVDIDPSQFNHKNLPNKPVISHDIHSKSITILIKKNITNEFQWAEICKINLEQALACGFVLNTESADYEYSGKPFNEIQRFSKLIVTRWDIFTLQIAPTHIQLLFKYKSYYPYNFGNIGSRYRELEKLIIEFNSEKKWVQLMNIVEKSKWNS